MKFVEPCRVDQKIRLYPSKNLITLVKDYDKESDNYYYSISLTVETKKKKRTTFTTAAIVPTTREYFIEDNLQTVQFMLANLAEQLGKKIGRRKV